MAAAAAMGQDGVKAGGSQSRNYRVAVAGWSVALMVLAAIYSAALVRIAELEEAVRDLTMHGDQHHARAESCRQALERVPPYPAHGKRYQNDSRGAPRGPESKSELLFQRAFPRVESAISSCAERAELECATTQCIDLENSDTTPGYTGTFLQRCTRTCAALSECNYFWLWDRGGCCFKASYDEVKALGQGGLRTGLEGDYYQLTQRGPPPPPYVGPVIGVGKRVGDTYECSNRSWAGENPMDSTRTAPRTVRFKDKDSVPSTTLPSMLEAIQTTNHDGEERRYVDLGGGQRCIMKNKESLYDIGVLTHFSHALVKMDEIVDCSGPIVHVAVNRPDLTPNKIKRPTTFRAPLAPRDYNQAKLRVKQTHQRFKYAFLLTYTRDSNYQMFVVSCLSRWWFMLQLVEADWSQYGGPGPSDTVAIIVSGAEGGSAEAKHRGGSTKDYIPNTIRLLAMSLPFQVEVVPEDSEIYADNLWVPGVVFMNYSPCALRNAERGIEEVTRILKENSLASYGKLNAAGTITAERKAQLDSLRKERIYIGRLDAISHRLDGEERAMQNEEELGRQLQELGFSVVQAADYSEEEKAYIFENSKVVVLPMGAGMTNLLWAAPRAKVVFLCAPSITAFKGQNMCDWARDYYLPIYLKHLQMTATVLRHGMALKGHGFNRRWKLRDVSQTVAVVQTCINGTMRDSDCVPAR